MTDFQNTPINTDAPDTDEVIVHTVPQGEEIPTEQQDAA